YSRQGIQFTEMSSLETKTHVASQIEQIPQPHIEHFIKETPDFKKKEMVEMRTQTFRRAVQDAPVPYQADLTLQHEKTEAADYISRTLEPRIMRLAAEKPIEDMQPAISPIPYQQ